MKKLALGVLALISCGSLFASQSITVVNTDPESVEMIVTYKVCNNPTAPTQSCEEKEHTVTLSGKNWAGGPTFARIPVEDKKMIVITSVDTWLSHHLPQRIVTVFSEKDMSCSASGLDSASDSEVITLDTLGTGTGSVICNNRNKAGVTRP